jgi:hypothetical protein
MSTAASMNDRSKNTYLKSLVKTTDSHTFQKYYVDSGIIGIFFIMTAFFVLVALVWVFLEIYLFLDRISEYATLLDNITAILFGFLYYIWIVRALNGYDHGPDQLINIMEETLVFATKVDQLSHAGDDNEDNVNLGITSNNNGRHGCRENEPAVIQTLELCVAMEEMVLGLFCHNKGEYTALIPQNVQKRLDIEPDIHMKMKVIMGAITRRLRVMSESKCMTAPSVTMLMDIQRDMEKKIQAIYVDSVLVTPRIFDHFMNLSLSFYFFIIIPFKIVTVARWYTLLLYPVLMHILAGAVIARAWIGEPFDPKKKLSVMSFSKWRKNYVTAVRKVITDRKLKINVDNGFRDIDEGSQLQKIRIKHH